MLWHPGIMACHDQANGVEALRNGQIKAETRRNCVQIVRYISRSKLQPHLCTPDPSALKSLHTNTYAQSLPIKCARYGRFRYKIAPSAFLRSFVLVLVYYGAMSRFWEDCGTFRLFGGRERRCGIRRACSLVLVVKW